MAGIFSGIKMVPNSKIARAAPNSWGSSTNPSCFAGMLAVLALGVREIQR
jgi:hypothetical protein